MCGRYVFIPDKNFYSRYDVDGSLVNLPTHYNSAPGMIMPVVIRQSPNSVVLMKWGLIPNWAKDPKIGYKTINARAETVMTKPSFRKAFLRQRCLVPANGFYEWKKSGNLKIPYFIRHKTEQYISFAGLFDSWSDSEGKEIKTYTIVTTAADELLIKIHSRMPVILKREEENMWLDINTENETLSKLLSVSAKSSPTEAYPVSKEVNKISNDGSNLIKPILNSNSTIPKQEKIF